MQEEMIAFIRENPDGIDSVELARRFLKFKSPDPLLARRAISGILNGERRCRIDDSGRWTAQHSSSPGVALTSLPCVAVQVLTAPHDPRTVHHIAAWDVNPDPAPLLSQWIRDPAHLSADEQAVLINTRDATFDPAGREQARDTISGIIEKRLPVYLTWMQQSVLMREFALAGDCLPDDGMSVATLLRCAGLPVPRPLTLDSLVVTLPGLEPPAGSAFQKGEFFAHYVAELLGYLSRSGIETIDDLKAKEAREVPAADFTGKTFSKDTLLDQPSSSGVYAFKDGDGRFLYIGKSRNLRQRLLHYFQPGDESPAKLERLRKESHSLTVHPCGSELESLIYEYRLIRKHSPLLNRQTEIHERPGTYRPVHDCVVLLDHALEGKVMSFWFKNGEKVLLKPLDAGFPADESTAKDLEEFFFQKTPPEPTNFAEDEIAFRWIKRHAGSVPLVRADAVASGSELYDAMGHAWRDYQK